MLDAHLCVVYANVGAQDLLAVGLNQARGRPISELFAEPQALRGILRRSLERSETCAGHEIVLLPTALAGHARSGGGRHHRDAARGPGHRHAPAARARRCPHAPAHHARERDAVAPGRQPADDSPARARDQKSARRTARRRAAARSRAARRRAEGIHHRHHQRGRSPARAGRQHARALAPAAEDHWSTSTSCASTCFICCAARRRPASSIERDYDPSLPSGAVRSQRDHPGAAQRRAQRAAGGRAAPAAASRCARACCPTSTSAPCAIAWWPISRSRTTVTACRRSCIAACSIRWSPSRPNGTGLGLAVAQDLVTRHRGIVEFESRPGHTVFSLLLPLEGAE